MTRAKLRLLLLCPAAVLATGPAAAQSLQDVLSKTYLNNPEIAVQRDAVNVAAETIAQAQAGWFRPTITGTAAEGVQIIQQEVDKTAAAGTMIEDLDETITDRSLTMSLLLPLYEGGATMAQIAYSREIFSAATAALLVTEQDVLARTAKAYLNVVMALEILDSARHHAGDISELRDRIAKRLQDHQATVTDLHQADVSVAVAKIAMQTATVSLQNAYSSFYELVGDYPQGRLDWPPLPAPPADLASAIDMVQQSNPSVAEARHMIAASDALVRATKAGFLPKLSLSGSAERLFESTRFTGSTNFHEFESETIYKLGVTLTVPLYQSGAQSSRVRAQIGEAKKSRNSLLVTQRAAQNSVITAWQTYVGAQRAIQLGYERWLGATKIVEGKEREYQRQKATIDDVLDAHTAVFTAKQYISQNKYSEHAGLVSLFQGIGVFGVESLGVPVERYDSERYRKRIEALGWVPYLE